MIKKDLVSIIIPTYNRKKLTERLLKSILKSSYKNYEIIVIDDASSDDTSEYLRKRFKKINIQKNRKNLFAAGSRNVGQKLANGEFILFIDDDNVIDKNMISELVNALKNDLSIGEVGPINYNFNNKKLILLSRSTRNMFTTKTYHLRSLSPFKDKSLWDADDIPNSYMVRAEIIKKYNIQFRKEYGIMYEESDYAYRIKKLGYRICMVRAAKIYHDIEDTSKTKSKDYLYHFMQDRRRPFVFARNRIIFHWRFSSKLQNIGILSFWIWFFSVYYCYKLAFYSGHGDFKVSQRINSSLSYLMGTFNGLYIILLKGTDYERI